MRDKQAKDTFDLEKMKADAKVMAQRINTNGFVYGADKMLEGKKYTADVQAGATVDKENEKLDNKKQELQDKATIDLQKSLISEPTA